MTDYFTRREFEGFTYVTNRLFIAIAFVIILVLGFVSLNYSKFSGETYYYSECNDRGKCFNSFYKSNLCIDGTIDSTDPLCTTMFILEGEHLGNKAPFLVRNFAEIGGLVVFLILLLNTLIYNKGFFAWVWSKVKD